MQKQSKHTEVLIIHLWSVFLLLHHHNPQSTIEDQRLVKDALFAVVAKVSTYCPSAQVWTLVQGVLKNTSTLLFYSSHSKNVQVLNSTQVLSQRFLQLMKQLIFLDELKFFCLY